MTALVAPSRGTALAVLARSEARLLAGQAAPWPGAALTVALCRFWYAGGPHDWTGFAANAGLASLILAGVLLIAGHLASSRDHRHGAGEAASVLPAPPGRRTAALFALVPAAGVAGAGALGAELLLTATAWPQGHVSGWELLTPVLIPMLGAATGVATGRWLPSSAAGPLVLFACAAILAVLPVFATGPGSLAWAVFPVTLRGDGGPPPAPGWHALYLLALLGAAVAAGTLRNWRLWPAVTLVTAATIAVLAIAIPR